jgi:hypothetical protein
MELHGGEQIALGHAMLRLRIAGGSEEESSIARILRNRWALAGWAIFAAAIATGFAGVSLWQVYRLTAVPPATVPVLEVTTQPETTLLPTHVRPPPRPTKPALRTQRIELAAARVSQEQTEATPPAPIRPVGPPSRPIRRYRPNVVHAPIVRPKTPAVRAVAMVTPDPSPPPVPAKALLPKTTSNLLAELEPQDNLAAHYEGGDAAGALELARQAGDLHTTQLVARFRRAYTDGQRSLAEKDVPEAKRQFELALELDGQIARGRGWYHSEIKRHLSALNTLEGDREASLENVTAARQSYREALILNPGNRQARSKLDALSEDSIASAPSKVRTGKQDARASAIDEAFEKD